MNAVQERHETVVNEIAASYEARGYIIDRRPSLSYEGTKIEADLLARKGADVVLIEVKVVRAASAVETSALRPLAELARKSGWRLVIAIADAAGVEEVEVSHTSALEERIWKPGKWIRTPPLDHSSYGPSLKLRLVQLSSRQAVGFYALQIQRH